MQDPQEIPADAEAWLWAERLRRAAEWAPGDDDETISSSEQAASVTTGWPARDLHSEHLLGQWEEAAASLARWQSVQIRVLAEALELALSDGTAGRDAELCVRSLAAELACAVGMSDRTVAQHMADAAVLRLRFAGVFAAMADGRLARSHAQVIADEGLRLADDEVRAEYERIVLERAAGMTTGRLRAMARAIAEQLLPGIAERHRAARTLRQVTVRDVDDGMAQLSARLPAVLAHGIFDRLTQTARTIADAEAEEARRIADADSTSDDARIDIDADIGVDTECVDEPPRTLDQLRADVLCDLALTGHPTARAADRHGGNGLGALRGIVQITVPVQALMGRAGGAPATLAGGCPIDAETARTLAGGATIWDRILTDPMTGDVLVADRRFPTEAQRRLLRARDEHCRFPGCRMAVWRCDVDHTRDHQHGGPTEPCNLAHLCRRHHMLKHNTAWTVEQREHGVLEWTSPLGRTYIDRPPPTLRFVPERGS